MSQPNARSADAVTIAPAALFGGNNVPAQVMRQKQTPLFTLQSGAATSAAQQLSDAGGQYAVVALQCEQDMWIAFGGAGVIATVGGATNTWFFTRGQYLVPVPLDATGAVCTYLAVIKHLTAGYLQCLGVA